MWKSWIFSNYYSSLQVSHDPSEIILIFLFGAQEWFLIVSVGNSCAASIFVDSLMNGKFKRTELLLSLMINLMHPCWIEFNLKKKILLASNFWKVVYV